MPGVTAAEIQKYLKGMDYPSDKNKLVNKAKENGAKDEVLKTIEMLPEHQYNSPIDVEKEFSNIKHQMNK